MIDILMPRLSDTMTEGAISAWRKKVGDRVEPGDVVVEIETDKALMEQEAYDAGTLVEILVPEGTNVAIGTPIARLDDGQQHDTEDGAVSGETAAGNADPAEGDAPAPDDAGSSTAIPVVANDDDRGERRAATPLVRKLARERGIDLNTLSGSGPGGRIVRADLPPTNTAARPALVSPIPADQTDSREPRMDSFDAVRQSMAARLTASGTTPTFTATASADVHDLLALRAQINAANAEGGVKVSVNDFLVRAVAVALRTNPRVNASYDAEKKGAALLHGRIHVGVAVASPAGLVVPVVRDADRASISTIAQTTREFVAKAAERKLTLAEMSDGTFTISNLGMFGIDHFTAIINPPQGAILAVGAVREEVTLRDGKVEGRKRLTVTLTADHRIIDGADAARFLSTLTTLLENPLRVLS